MNGTLFIVATPIGNLEDITLRALKVLKEVEIIACEDTRRTLILLRYYNIEKPLISYHQHSKLQKIEEIIEKLQAGQNIALVTDAGTPGIADPGGVLIARALRSNIKVEPIPGAFSGAVILSVAGISADKFLFLGFLPKKKGRQTILNNFKNFPYPIVIFESPQRINRTLDDIKNSWGDRQVIIGREMTKKFESIYRGKISEIQIREQGEFVIIINHE